MTNTTTKRSVKKLCDGLYARYISIDTAADLQREKLTQCEYTALRDHVAEFLKDHKTVTMISGIAEWFERNGCKVTYGYKGVNYLIEA